MEETRKKFLKFADGLIEKATYEIEKKKKDEYIISSAIRVGGFIYGLNCCMESFSKKELNANFDARMKKNN